jgi:uncharacterized phage-associated protein
MNIKTEGNAMATVFNDAKYSAQQIAEWFLSYNKLMKYERDAEEITNMKLQKLLYYAQGASLAINGQPLFDNPILAWPHGPVVESVYRRYKEYGSNGINAEPPEPIALNDGTQSVLEQVYDVFGQYTAWKLREMTHEEAPWATTSRGGVIGVQKIKDYFMENYIEQSAEA